MNKYTLKDLDTAYISAGNFDNAFHFERSRHDKNMTSYQIMDKLGPTSKLGVLLSEVSNSDLFKHYQSQHEPSGCIHNDIHKFYQWVDKKRKSSIGYKLRVARDFLIVLGIMTIAYTSCLILAGFITNLFVE